MTLLPIVCLIGKTIAAAAKQLYFFLLSLWHELLGYFNGMSSTVTIAATAQCLTLRFAVTENLNLGTEMTTTVHTLRIDQRLTLTAAFSDGASNQVAAPGAVPAWTGVDSALATLEVSADGITAVITPTGKLGEFEVTASVVNARGHTLTSSATVTFVAGDAVAETLTAVVSDILAVEPAADTPAHEETITEAAPAAA